MDEALKERAKILDAIIPDLFKSEMIPSESLIKKICIHKHLATNFSKINAIKTIKVDSAVEKIMETYNKNLEVINKEEIKSTCPLTSGNITDPWIGQCGHCFEKSAVISYLKQSKYCPVLGCNKVLVKK
jgi:hypothetical protein